MVPFGLRGPPPCDCLVHSLTLDQHLLDVTKVLEIFGCPQLYAKSSKCKFERQVLGFLGHSQRKGARCSPSSSGYR